MSWRDRLQKASFRAVDFWVDGTSATKGRRVPVRRLAGRDGSIQQDLGRNEDAFGVSAFLWGPDFDVERDELESALLEPGPGALVLPTRGELWARIVGDVVTDERKNEGYCTIRFQVVLEDRSVALRTRTDTASNLKTKSAALKVAAKADFDSKMSIAGMPSKYVRQAVRAVNAVTTRLRDVQGKINGVLNPLEDLTASILDVERTVDDLLNTPQALSNKLLDLVSAVFESANTTRNEVDRVTGLRVVNVSAYEQSLSVRVTKSVGLDGMGGDEPEGSTEDDATLAERSAENVRAIYRLSRSVALAQQVETYADAPFDSATLAVDVLGTVNDEIDALQEYGADDNLFTSLSDTRAATAQHLTRTAGDLPKTIKHTPKQEIPALLIAHYLYGDARQEADLVARNRLSNPNCVSGEIEIVEPT